MSNAEPLCICRGMAVTSPHHTRAMLHYVGASECLADPFEADVFRRDGIELRSAQGEVTLYRREQGKRDIGVVGFVKHRWLISAAVHRSAVWIDVLGRSWIVCSVDHLGYDGFAEVRLVRHMPARRVGGAI